ncbi:BglG family transcription antiterminator [Ignavigranum ruoffiae]|uniref:BglG family transcription antiterminator n=1 Tax=Ignavigranum ruoffiae TaxID=89093 RepID=UPI0024AD975A|nr:PRD domain-containing protein [Ignavigranum ruoffiae]
MLNKKEWQILDVLQNIPDEYISSQEIAKLVQYSDKTVRKYLNGLDKVLNENGASLDVKQGLGYKLTIQQPVLFNFFWQSELKKRIHPQKITDIEESRDRQHFILNKLFFDHQQVSVADLEDLLFLSNTSVLATLKEIRLLIEPYHLNLVNRGNQGLDIDGSEKNKRKFMMDYFFTPKFDQSLMPYISEAFFGNEINLNELTIIVLDEIREAQLPLSDYIIHNLVLHIALTIKRLEAGYSLDNLELDNDYSHTKEFEVAQKIISRLEKTLSIQFPINENKYIVLHLINKGSGRQKLPENRDSLKFQIEQALSDLSKALKGKISLDQTLIEGVHVHFQQLLNRLKNNSQISNPLTDDILSNYQDEFGLTKKYLAKMPYLASYSVNNDEWAYVVLHILAAIERYYQQRKLNILVVCATGYGSAQMLRNRLEHEFGHQLKIKDVISYYDITDEYLKNVDLVISSINLDNLYLPIPVLTVNVLLDKEDVNLIRGYLKDIDHRDSISQKEGFILKEELFTDCFNRHRFLYITQKIEKNKLLIQMIELLESELPKESFLHEFYKEIQIRERYGATVFDNILAIPHPNRALTDKEQIVVAIIPDGMYWDVKHPSVKYIFLLSPSTHSNRLMRQVSKGLIHIVQDRMIQDKLDQAKTYDNFCLIFSEMLKDN